MVFTLVYITHFNVSYYILLNILKTENSILILRIFNIRMYILYSMFTFVFASLIYIPLYIIYIYILLCTISSKKIIEIK